MGKYNPLDQAVDQPTMTRVIRINVDRSQIHVETNYTEIHLPAKPMPDLKLNDVFSPEFADLAYNAIDRIATLEALFNITK